MQNPKHGKGKRFRLTTNNGKYINSKWNKAEPEGAWVGPFNHGNATTPVLHLPPPCVGPLPSVPTDEGPHRALPPRPCPVTGTASVFRLIFPGWQWRLRKRFSPAGFAILSFSSHTGPWWPARFHSYPASHICRLHPPSGHVSRGGRPPELRPHNRTGTYSLVSNPRRALVNQEKAELDSQDPSSSSRHVNGHCSLLAGNMQKLPQTEFSVMGTAFADLGPQHQIWLLLF